MNGPRAPRCIVIAGPNGAGKTTFARRFLPAEGVVHFVNADLIAAGLSPFRPELAAVPAVRLMLKEMVRLADLGADFAIETTLGGLTHVRRLKALRRRRYRIQIVFLRLTSAQLAIRRVAVRVRQGGHHVPRVDVLRRHARGWKNFEREYRTLANDWTVFENSGALPQFLVSGDNAGSRAGFVADVRRALGAAARDARTTARRYGTPLYVWKNGKAVATKP